MTGAELHQNGMMLAWQVTTPGPIDGHPLELAEIPVPEPGPGELRMRVSSCGVCRTDLHVAEGDLAPHREWVVPGHEVGRRRRPFGGRGGCSTIRIGWLTEGGL